MKRNVLFIFLVLTITGFVNGQTDEWINYKSDDGNFSVLLPNKPKLKTETRVRQSKDLKTGDPNGNEVKYVNNRITSTLPGSFHLVGWANNHEGYEFDTKTELDATLNLFITGLDAKLVSEKPVKIGEHEGIEFVADKDPNGYVKGRLYLIGKRSYLIVGMSRDKKPNNIENIEKFLKSFVLNEEKLSANSK